MNKLFTDIIYRKNILEINSLRNSQRCSLKLRLWCAWINSSKLILSTYQPQYPPANIKPSLYVVNSKAKFACYSKCFLTSDFCIPVPYHEKDIFFGVFVSSKRSCRSSQNHSVSPSSALLVGAQTWITMILNGLPWKRTEIILSFLRLHPSTAFQTLLLTMMATPFLLRYSCPQQQI